MSKTKIRVSIIGGAGYGAAELLRHLLPRDDVELLRISSKDFVGQSIAQVHRTLQGFSELIIEDISPQQCAAGADFVFLAMPHIVTAKVATDLFELDCRIIDLSGDFRLSSLQDYQRDYSGQHPCPERLGSFVYGLPELNSEQIKTAKHLANPGCFATGIILGLLPLAAQGLLKQINVRTVAVTGSSGSGVSPQVGTHHPIRSNNLKAYKVLHHQHRSEIVQILAGAGAEGLSLDFAPISAPLSRGIFALSMLDLSTQYDEEKLRQLYKTYYGNNKMVRVMDAGSGPEVVAVAGTIRTEIGLDTRIDEATGQRTLCCSSAIDNLVKGGAGQAIQSFNLMTGKTANFGLEAPGLWP